METPIGRCSRCGGVVVCWEGPWHGIIPPTPRCTKCGAVKRGPSRIIDMDAPERQRYYPGEIPIPPPFRPPEPPMREGFGVTYNGISAPNFIK